MTPTSVSWLNAVEGFFAKLTRRWLKRGVFLSVDDLKAAIERFVAETNDNPKPFVWTAKPNRVLAAVKRGKRWSQSTRIKRPGNLRAHSFRARPQQVSIGLYRASRFRAPSHEST
jgi:transposase